MFIKGWMDTCAKFFADAHAIRESARVYRFKERPLAAQDGLEMRGAVVWDAHPDVPGNSTVILYGNGDCEARGRRVDPADVRGAFEKVVEGKRSPDVRVERVSTEWVDRRGVVLHRVTYRLFEVDEQRGWAFVATTYSGGLEPFEAVLSVRRAR